MRTTLIRAGLRAEREQEPPAAYEPPVLDTGAPLVDVTHAAKALEALDDRRCELPRSQSTPTS